MRECTTSSNMKRFWIHSTDLTTSCAVPKLRDQHLILVDRDSYRNHGVRYHLPSSMHANRDSESLHFSKLFRSSRKGPEGDKNYLFSTTDYDDAHRLLHAATTAFEEFFPNGPNILGENTPIQESGFVITYYKNASVFVSCLTLIGVRVQYSQSSQLNWKRMSNGYSNLTGYLTVFLHWRLKISVEIGQTIFTDLTQIVGC